MLVVHHLNNSRSQRVLWLLEELEVPYEIQYYKRDKVTLRAPAALRKIHPLGKSPVITDGDQVVAETGALIEYVIARFGEGRLIPPPDTAERLRYTYWLHYAEGSAMTPLLLKLIFTLLPQKSPFLVRPVVSAIAGQVHKTVVDPQLKLHSKYWESELEKSTWFAGEEFTAADIIMSFPLEAALKRANVTSPRVKSFAARIHARPAYQKALEKGGEYDYT